MRQDSEHNRADTGMGTPCCLLDLPLRSLEHRAHLVPPLLEQAALIGQGHRLVQVLAGAEMVAQFVVSGAEAGR